MTEALGAVVPLLRCPACDGRLRREQQTLRCARGHAFDLARQGYVNLLTGHGGPGTGDTAAMITARETVLASGLFDPVRDAVVAAAVTDGVVLDLAGGTGHYLAAVLDPAPHARGIVLDSSSAALRRAARIHPRAAAVGADAWARLPLAAESVTTVLSVFGPRTADELERVLAPGGGIVLVAPEPDHLRELVEPLGLVRIDPDKQQREATTFARFTRTEERRIRAVRDIDRDLAAALIGMGPSARHTDSEALAARLPDGVSVTVSVRVVRYRRPGD